MNQASHSSFLPDLAFLHLAVAYGTDEYLSDAELGTIIETLDVRFPEVSEASLQTVVAKALAMQMDTDDAEAAVEAAARRVAHHLSREQQKDVLDELVSIAEADGVVSHRERVLLRRLSAQWQVELPPVRASSLDVPERSDGSWTVLHDLAFLYLVLAHATDDELSVTEVQVIFAKLQEWQPQLGAEDLEQVLNAAIDRYTLGPDQEVLGTSIRALRTELPEEQRMAALNDLVQIANADGVFLDDEEDMINELMDAWEVAAFANYGDHGSKDSDAISP